MSKKSSPQKDSDNTPSAENSLKIIDVVPAKDFFVEMLTRDIALEDAILDLLDNCVDGILRSKSKLTGKSPYAGFYAKIEYNKEMFCISDNCGGIPWDERQYAFKLGRDLSLTRKDTGKATVGAYGIGMKRALFKLGRHSYVTTKSRGEEAWQVEIKPDWFEIQDDWKLPVERASSLINHIGTELVVHKLRDGVADLFDENNALFTDALEKRIQTQYAYILDKGFEVTINGRSPILGRPTKLLFQKPTGKPDEIFPYLYQASIEGVDIFLAVGFTHRPPPPPMTEDSESTPSKRSSEDAGWTILCNERAVIFNDKSFLTGWGERPVPQYHTQFIAIAGVVEFRSDDPKKLPMTTTKHGVDASSTLYLRVKNEMRRGMKYFTDFTNRWKGDLETMGQYFENSGEAVPFEEIKNIASSLELTPGRRGLAGEKFLAPDLPRPKKPRTDKLISFYRSKEEIEQVSIFLFGEESREPEEIGGTCFDQILKQSSKSKK